jgi:MYXO-CTERM domain-containing protein
MNKTRLSAAVFSLACVTGAALAQDISTVNGYNMQLRSFNDFPTSNLQWGSAGAATNPGPVPGNFPLAPFSAGVEFNEQLPAGTGGFANRHEALFSNDHGATPFGVNQFQSFTISTGVSITTNPGSPRKEGGLKLNNNRGGGFIDEGEILVAGDNGEVAAFGGNMLFFTFGVGTYTPGTTGHLTYNYFAPGAVGPVAAYQIIFTDAVTGLHNSGVIGFDPAGASDPLHPANGLNTGSTLGFLDQNQRLSNGDFADVVYSNPSVVPTPGVVGLLGLGGLGVARRRRR